MSSLGEYVKQADWKTEKHAPVVSCPDSVAAGEAFTVEVSVGKEIPHPNTVEHHIAWISLYFVPEGGAAPFQVGRYDYSGHGEGPVLAEPTTTAVVKLEKSGTFYAISFCNLHGLWEGSKAVSVG